MAHIYLQGLLLLVLFVVISDCSDDSLVIASQEDDAVLPCFNSTAMNPKSCYRVKWIKHGTDLRQMKVILARPKTPKIRDAERVKWEADGKGQMSLFLTKLQKSDEGLYSCEIWRGWECMLVKNISLKVKECKPLQAVKTAPGTPINLSCSVDMTSGQQGPQNVSWVMLKGGNPVPVNSKKAEINGTSLAIHSVNYSDSGWYRCKYMLGQTQRCFDIYLLVQVEDAAVTTTVQALTATASFTKTRKEGSSGAFIAVVASVIFAIAIIAAPTGLFIYRRRNTQRAAQWTQRQPAGTPVVSSDDYETVNLTLPDDPTNQQPNPLYQQFQDENSSISHFNSWNEEKEDFFAV
ncbi:CXADR-like membrane protein [Chaetodon auriga]|uniref:CXADR-like membrane protein n=1 Tax=Chaetodon auriga TaxID=39042 RepID=UPI004032A61F